MATLSTIGIDSELNLACKELNFSESLEKKFMATLPLLVLVVSLI